MSRAEEIRNAIELYTKEKNKREKEVELNKLKIAEQNEFMLLLEEKVNKMQRAVEKFANGKELTPEENELLENKYVVIEKIFKYNTDEEVFKNIEDKVNGFGMYPIREGYPNVKSPLVRIYYPQYKEARDNYLESNLECDDKSNKTKLIYNNYDTEIDNEVKQKNITETSKDDSCKGIGIKINGKELTQKALDEVLSKSEGQIIRGLLELKELLNA